MVATKVKRLVIEDGLFPAGGPAFTNERLDVAAARQVVGAGGWPTPIAWVDGYDGIETKVGGMLCTVVPSSQSDAHRLRGTVRMRSAGRR